MLSCLVKHGHRNSKILFEHTLSKNWADERTQKASIYLLYPTTWSPNAFPKAAWAWIQLRRREEHDTPCFVQRISGYPRGHLAVRNAHAKYAWIHACTASKSNIRNEILFSFLGLMYSHGAARVNSNATYRLKQAGWDVESGKMCP